MSAPKLHYETFTTKNEAPPMDTIGHGHRIRLTYSPKRADIDHKSIHGTVMTASYGRFADEITFKPDHRDNTWRLRIGNSVSKLEYKSNAPGSNWRILGTESVEAQIKPMITENDRR